MYKKNLPRVKNHKGTQIFSLKKKWDLGSNKPSFLSKESDRLRTFVLPTITLEETRLATSIMAEFKKSNIWIDIHEENMKKQIIIYLNLINIVPNLRKNQNLKKISVWCKI